MVDMNNEILIECPYCHNTKLNVIKDTKLNSMTLACIDCGKFVTFGAGMYIRNVWEFNLNTNQK